MYIDEHGLQADIYKSISTLYVDPETVDYDKNIPKNLCVVGKPLDFDKILEKDKNILLYMWSFSKDLEKKILNTRFEKLKIFTLYFNKDNIDSLASNAPERLSREIITELKEPLKAFIELDPEQEFKISFLKTFQSSCPLFHVDYLSLRFLCTLRGPGTEWLADNQVNRKKLGLGSNKKIAKRNAIVQQVKSMQICVLKGNSKRYDPKEKGVVHRSPSSIDKILGRWYVRVDIDKKQS